LLWDRTSGDAFTVHKHRWSAADTKPFAHRKIHIDLRSDALACQATLKAAQVEPTQLPGPINQSDQNIVLT